MNRPWWVVCPKCGQNFTAPEVLAYKVVRVTKVEPRGRDDRVRDEARGEKLEREAIDRVRELEKVEVLGELNAIRKLLVERRAAIADLQEQEAALRKKVRQLGAE
jgi:uncharacterized Zn finger protein (UPF0148 family)